jgi:fatty acid desaturase
MLKAIAQNPDARLAAQHPDPDPDSDQNSKQSPKPSLTELGTDLLITTRRQRTMTLSRPYVGIAVFAAAAWLRWWWLTPVAAFAIFVSVVTAAHNVVHRTLGLSGRATDWALFAVGAVLLESGHAFQATHKQHHRLFPGPGDPEGYPAGLSLVAAIAYGPVFLIRLWFWSFRAGRQRLWLVAEGAVPILALAGGILLWPYTPGVLLYAVTAVVGSWVYPLLTVYLPHNADGDAPLTQTRTMRGRVMPKILLENTYHLEHHLYPQVPTHRLPELARRLEGYFAANGVSPIRIP